MNNLLINFLIKFHKLYVSEKSKQKTGQGIYKLFDFSIIEFFRFKFMKYKFISLGDHCITRMLLTGARLKAQKKYGEKTCPFDIVQNKNIKSIINYIRNDFKDFYDGLEYNPVYKEWHNQKFDSHYIHDTGLTLEEFRKIYDRRIKNFLDYCKSSKKICFVFSTYILEPFPTKEDILDLYNALKEKRGNKDFILILLLKEYIEGIDKENIYQIKEPPTDKFQIAKGYGGLFQLLTIGKIKNINYHLGYTEEALKYYTNTVKKLKDIIKTAK